MKRFINCLNIIYRVVFGGRRAKIKVAVAMSGGVDSSAVAAILKSQGYDVFGVFFHFWSEPNSTTMRDNVCCSLESERDARRVADKLGIKFYTLNLATDFKDLIVDDFLAEYRAGHTPNPCVRCNRYIKMGEALTRVRAMGADYLATGHYARVKVDRRGQAHLLNARDKHKDQTYFLHRLTQEQLKHLLFPLGKYKKPQVRRIAAKHSLAVASKRESQEVCFIPSGKVTDFLGRYLELRPGSIVNAATGAIIGRHEGLPGYTIGQRKGIGLPGGPWYVSELDVASNTLKVIGDVKKLEKTSAIIKSVNWLSGAAPRLPLRVRCRLRYASTEFGATLVYRDEDFYCLKFEEPQVAVTPGQSAVFWRGPECLGGGIIE